jgi:hypothetical protein
MANAAAPLVDVDALRRIAISYGDKQLLGFDGASDRWLVYERRCIY